MIFHKSALQNRKSLLNSFLIPLHLGRFSAGVFSRGTRGRGEEVKDGYEEG